MYRVTQAHTRSIAFQLQVAVDIHILTGDVLLKLFYVNQIFILPGAFYFRDSRPLVQHILHQNPCNNCRQSPQHLRGLASIVNRPNHLKNGSNSRATTHPRLETQVRCITAGHKSSKLVLSSPMYHLRMEWTYLYDRPVSRFQLATSETPISRVIQYSCCRPMHRARVCVA